MTDRSASTEFQWRYGHQYYAAIAGIFHMKYFHFIENTLTWIEFNEINLSLLLHSRKSHNAWTWFENTFNRFDRLLINLSENSKQLIFFRDDSWMDFACHSTALIAGYAACNRTIEQRADIVDCIDNSYWCHVRLIDIWIYSRTHGL